MLPNTLTPYKLVSNIYDKHWKILFDKIHKVAIISELFH